MQTNLKICTDLTRVAIPTFCFAAVVRQTICGRYSCLKWPKSRMLRIVKKKISEQSYSMKFVKCFSRWTCTPLLITRGKKLNVLFSPQCPQIKPPVKIRGENLWPVQTRNPHIQKPPSASLNFHRTIAQRKLLLISTRVSFVHQQLCVNWNWITAVLRLIFQLDQTNKSLSANASLKTSLLSLQVTMQADRLASVRTTKGGAIYRPSSLGLAAEDDDGY